MAVGHPRRLSQLKKRDVTLTNNLVPVEVKDNSHKAVVMVVEQEGEVVEEGEVDHEDVNMVHKVMCEMSIQMKKLATNSGKR